MPTPLRNNSPTTATATTADSLIDGDPTNDDVVIQQVKKSSVQGAISYFGRSLFLNGLGFASALVLSGYLNPSEFGVFGYVTQFVGLLSFLADIGLAAALIQSKEDPTSEELSTTFTVQFGLSLVILVVFVLLSQLPLIASKGVAAQWLSVVLGLSFPLATLKVIPSVLLERKLAFQKLVVPQIVEQVLYNGILIALVVSGWGVMAFSVAVIVRAVSGVLSMWWVQPWSPRLRINKAVLKRLANFGVLFQLNDLLARFKDQFFYIVLGTFYPPATFGYISWAKNWSMYPYTLTVQNVMAVTFPTFSRLQHHPELLAKAINKTTYFISVTIFPLLVGMCVMLIPFVQMVPRFQKWEPALASFVWFTLSIGWGAISTPITNTLNAIGKIDVTLRLMVMWTSLTWILSPLFAWWFGFTGIAIAAFVIAGSSLVPIVYIQRLVPGVAVWKHTWQALVAGCAMAFVGVMLMPFAQHDFITWVITGVVISATYWIVLLAIGWQKLRTEVLSLRSV
jgi:O-antigen/teichoic acid export membrane protein